MRPHMSYYTQGCLQRKETWNSIEHIADSEMNEIVETNQSQVLKLLQYSYNRIKVINNWKKVF